LQLQLSRAGDCEERAARDADCNRLGRALERVEARFRYQGIRLPLPDLRLATSSAARMLAADAGVIRSHSLYTL
jgi:hypothetical protein